MQDMTSNALPTASRAALRRIAALHEACADPARLRLLNLLQSGELCVCDLTELTGMSQPFVSRHLARPVSYTHLTLPTSDLV